MLVLETRQRAIFDAIHGLAHPSGRATLAIISKSYVWPSMRKEVLAWSRQCQSCQTSKVSRHTRPPVLPIPVPADRFEHVHVDIVGPFQPDRGYKYLLTFVDRTTRWTEATPITDTATESVIQAFLDTWVARFGIPATITTDRVAQFTSEAWRKTLTRLGINVSATTSYHPQANGMVERFHRSLKNSLRCAVRASKSWSRSLPWVLLGLRTAPRLDTATSAAEVVFGVPLRVPGRCFQSEQSQTATAAEQLESARTNVELFTPESLDLRHFKSSPFIAGALRMAKFVFVRDDRLGKPSLAPRYTGPYRALNRDWDNNTFTVDLGRRTDSVSLSRLKAANMSEEAG